MSRYAHSEAQQHTTTSATEKQGPSQRKQDEADGSRGIHNTVGSLRSLPRHLSFGWLAPQSCHTSAFSPPNIAEANQRGYSRHRASSKSHLNPAPQADQDHCRHASRSSLSNQTPLSFPDLRCHRHAHGMRINDGIPGDRRRAFPSTCRGRASRSTVTTTAQSYNGAVFRVPLRRRAVAHTVTAPVDCPL